MKKPLLLGILGLMLSIAVQAAAPERVRVTTNLGSFVIELQRDRAPLTVENFLTYVRAGHYTNTLFHRVISGFVIQGGGVGMDFKPKQAQKPIPNEAGNGLKNLRGTVGLARAAGPHTGDCQFYVNVADNDSALDPLPTRWGYAVFGRVTEGMEVVDRISISPTGPMPPFKEDAPLQAVVIQKVELLADVARSSGPTSTTQTSTSDFLSKLNAAEPGTPRRALLREHICQQVAKILEFDNTFVLDPHQPLAEVGLDSLMAIELRNMLSTSIDRQLPPTLLFDYPTIDLVYSYLATLVFDDEAKPAIETAVEVDPELEGILEELESLPDNTVEMMLQGYARELLK